MRRAEAFECRARSAKLHQYSERFRHVYCDEPFKVRNGEEATFERRWRERDTHLRTVSGFIEFHLLKGPERDDHTLYASHTLWQSHAEFEAWTRSAAFRAAHRDDGEGRSLTLGHPEFEGFEVVQVVGSTGATT